MGKVRFIIQGPINDYETFTTFVKKACSFVEENEPGALAYECFADEVNGRAVWHEIYADADAFVTHFENLNETGMLGDMLSVFTPEQVTLLTRVTDPRVREIAEQFGAVELHGVGGVLR